MNQEELQQQQQKIRNILQKKSALRKYYQEIYQRYNKLLERSPKQGLVVELGSGGGFAKEIVPKIITSDFWISNFDNFIFGRNSNFNILFFWRAN